MHFEKANLYHVYNQGNNRQTVFFNRENYLYFLRKMKIHLLPYSDILAYCLMPNHFHFMIYVKEVEVESPGATLSRTWDEDVISPGATLSRTRDEDVISPGATLSRTRDEDVISPGATLSRTRTMPTLNASIGIMLASYTRAVNKQERRTGSLFRKETKANNLTYPGLLAPNWFNQSGITLIHIKTPERQYPQLCFDYIHQNPVKAGLAVNYYNWEFSSYAEIAGIKGIEIINKERLAEYKLVLSS